MECCRFPVPKHGCDVHKLLDVSDFVSICNSDVGFLMARVFACVAMLLSFAAAAFVHPAGARVRRSSTTAIAACRSATPAMLAPIPLAGASAPSFAAAAATAVPASLLVADVFDAISGFANSPAVLLIPIGAGSLVAAAIIYVLVKSAG